MPVHIGLVGEQLRSEGALRALPGCVVLLPLVMVYAFDVPPPAPERLADITGVSRGSAAAAGLPGVRTSRHQRPVLISPGRAACCKPSSGDLQRQRTGAQS